MTDLTYTGLAAMGFVTALGTWILYLAQIPKGTVPRNPWSYIIAQTIAVTLAVISIIHSFPPTKGFYDLAILVPSLPALMFGMFFLWLLTQRKTPLGDLQVDIGDPLLPFQATTSEGHPFESADLEGKRILLKFFRGGW